MEEDLVSFEVAKLAKEIGLVSGFNHNDQYYCYDLNTFERIGKEMYSYCNLDAECSHQIKKYGWVYTPTQNLLTDWLRKKQNVFVSVLPFQDLEDECDLCWYYTLVNYNDPDRKNNDILCNENHLNASIDNFETYEEALEEGLLEALKLLTNQQS